MTNNMKKYKRPVVREIKADFDELLAGSSEDWVKFPIGTDASTDPQEMEHGIGQPFSKEGYWSNEWE